MVSRTPTTPPVIESENCGFSWALADRLKRADRALLDHRGVPIATYHDCPTCGLIHWCVPAAEAQGTAETVHEVAQQAMDACDAAGFVNPTGQRGYGPHHFEGSGG